MPADQLEVTDARRHRIRHIRPYEPGIGLTAGATVLGVQMGFEELPISPVPAAPDFSEGTWTGRLGDAGEGGVTFPNRTASDGQLWRERFDPDGHKEFLEIYRDDVLEQVVCILKAPVNQQRVEVAGQDGWFLLRDAYERDFQTVMAPRDVIERYTYVWDGAVLNDFTSTVSLVESNAGEEGINEDPELEVLRAVGEAAAHSGALQTLPTGLGVLAQNALNGELQWRLFGKKKTVLATNARWSLTVPFTITSLTKRPSIEVGLEDTTGTTIRVGMQFNETPEEVEQLNAASAFMWTGSGGVRQIALPLGAGPGPHTFQLECDGRFVRGYIDGYLIGVLPAEVQGTKGLKVSPLIFVTTDSHGENPASKIELVLNQWVFRVASPFLMRGTDKGDYVLPGDASTYPYGGITGRYYNDLDMQGLSAAARLGQCFASNRPGSGTGGSYKDRTDAQINSPQPPAPGSATTYWSVRWFGAIYLPLSKGNPTTTFKIRLGPTCAVRLWVGKTQFGQQLIDGWTQPAGERTLEATLTNANLGSKDGWYPIVLEFARGPEAPTTSTIAFEFWPSAEFTDPSGVKLKSVMQFVPPSVLSPLGCVDAHFQGQSHFALTQEIAADFGYQMFCTPEQLESGNFPGQLIPRVRVGRDTDEIVQEDDVAVKSPISAYQSTVDATDQVTSLRGTGAGLPTAQNSGQIQVEQFNIAAMKAALFDLQGWVDAADTNSPALLGIRVQSQLDLQVEPWQNVEGEPLARERLAYSFPLAGPLAAFRWLPGDGVRLSLPTVNIEDATPRQIMQVTRQFGPVGRHGSQVGFRNRPLDRLSAVNKALRRNTLAQRNYQKSVVTLPTFIGTGVCAPNISVFTSVPYLPGDQIVSARLIIAANTSGEAFEINNGVANVTSALGGPWKGAPVVLDVSKVIVSRNAANFNGLAQMIVTNRGASNTEFAVYFYVTVLR